jgi:hypothetical protein
MKFGRNTSEQHLVFRADVGRLLEDLGYGLVQDQRSGSKIAMTHEQLSLGKYRQRPQKPIFSIRGEFERHVETPPRSLMVASAKANVSAGQLEMALNISCHAAVSLGRIIDSVQ